MIKPYFETENGRLLNCDVLEGLASLPDESVHCCVTSPPYWGLRDYGHDGQLGLEATPEEYVQKMVTVFREVRRVLRKDGTCWINLGDSYCSTAPGTMGDKLNQKGILAGVSDRRAEGSRKNRPETPPGLKPKDLIGIPWRVAFALQADGWWLRQDIIWHKPNPMPESVTDRCTKSHEYIFLLSKSAKYFYDAVAISEKTVSSYYDKNKRKPGRMEGTRYITEGLKQVKVGKSFGLAGEDRNKRSVWSVNTKSYQEAHFATFPPKLIEPCILAGCPVGGTVLDPFFGSGTTGLVAYQHDRKFIGIELNPEYCAMSSKRIQHETQQLKLFK